MELLPRIAALLLTLGVLLWPGAKAAIKLPSYIKTCSRNDPNLNECALKSGRTAIQHLLNGDMKIKLPSLNPLRVEEIRVDQGGSVGLNLIMRDVDVYGLAESDLRDVRFDLDKHVLGIDLSVPNLQLIGKYNISGRILILPIYGQGDSNITVENVSLKYNMIYNVETRKGKQYMRIVDKTVGFDTTKAYFTFENLFNGDERLRANIRQVVNENWRQVIDDIGPSVADAIAGVVTRLLRSLLTLIPYDEIFPNTPK